MKLVSKFSTTQFSFLPPYFLVPFLGHHLEMHIAGVAIPCALLHLYKVHNFCVAVFSVTVVYRTALVLEGMVASQQSQCSFLAINSLLCEYYQALHI